MARFDVADLWLKKLLKGTRVRATAVRTIDVLQPVTAPRRMADLRKAADNLRTMARRYRRPDDMKWRRAVANAVGQTLLGAAFGGKPEQARIDLIMEYAAAAGETEWAQCELLPLITLRPLSSPDLSQSDLLTLLAGAVASIGWATDMKRLIAAQAAARDAQTGQPEIAGIFCPT